MKKNKPPARTPRSQKITRRAALPRVTAPPEARLGYHLWQVHYAWHREIERQLGEFNLTHLQYVLLAAANTLQNADEAPSQSDLVRYTKIEKMMVSKIVRALEARGYLRRRPHPDNRKANVITLTASGVRILQSAFDAAVKAHAQFFKAIGSSWRKFDQMLLLLMPAESD